MKFLHLNFLPRSVDFALLALRLWFGLSMLFLHGWGKLAGFADLAPKFANPFGLGSTFSLVLTIFAEVVCAAMIAVGAFTRFAALVLGANMFVAFWMVHGHRLTGTGNGELAFLFFGAFVTLFCTGAGKFSVDAQIGART